MLALFVVAAIDTGSIDPATGEVTVKVVRRAWSLVAGRLSISKPHTKVSATGISRPPTL